MIISIVNCSKSIGDDELQCVIRAINHQIADDFFPYWSFGARLRLEGRIGKKPTKEKLQDLRGDAIIYLWDKSDVQNALGYHSANAHGIPYGFVFTELSKQLGEPWSVTLSHEALELLGDAQGNLLVQGPHPNQPAVEVFHWFEMCDAVQSQTYKIDGVEVSNFVLPLYFTVDIKGGGRNDFLGMRLKGKTLQSFGVAPGGYIGFYDPRTRSQETYSIPRDKQAKERLRIKNANLYGRGYLRKRSEAPADREKAHLGLLSGGSFVKAQATQNDDPIKHVVVLMLENRSFDHMLGGMTKINPKVDGIPENKPNSNEETVTRKTYTQKPIAINSLPHDLPHEHVDTMAQLDAKYGMSGFIDTYRKNNPAATDEEFEQLMAYFPFGGTPNDDSLPALHALARNFAVCDRWFSSMPGPTWQNRFFVHSGTCLGHLLMPSKKSPQNMRLYYQETIYDRLSDANIDWRIYHDGIPQSIVMTNLLSRYLTFRGYSPMEDFYNQTAGNADDFPEYVFIEPSYFNATENDQHPPTDVHRGEKLIADVYNAIRGNEKLWNSTLLIVTYDEHGGFFDHVSPPATVPPDQHTNDWSFDRLGVRVPTLLVSPWVDPGIINTTFDHTSILRYLCEKWNLPPLGLRMQEQAGQLRANNFSDELTKRKKPRTDTPEKIEGKALKQFKTTAIAPPIEGAREALLMFIQQLPETGSAQGIKDPRAAKLADGKKDRAKEKVELPLSADAALEKLERIRQSSAPTKITKIAQ